MPVKTLVFAHVLALDHALVLALAHVLAHVLRLLALEVASPHARALTLRFSLEEVGAC